MASRSLTIASFGIALILLLTRTPCAQPPTSAETEPSDSIRIITDLPDAALADTSVVTDTLETERSDVDTLIFYSARSIEFFVEDKQTLLRGNAEVKYQKMHLRAEQITVDWENDLIIAEGVADTAWADSARTVVDTVLIRGQPIISEAGQEIVGERMTYNLKSRRGRVTEGTTQYQEGYYWGGAMRKEPNDVLYAGPGSFTTCEYEDPHFCFRTQQMKLMVGDKVVAKPVVLQFGEVPVGILPYGVFPARSGRHSGLIVPTYGESASQGRFIRHLGYYWATNDYMDFTGSLDYYERSGFLLNGRMVYNWRYHLSGSVDGSYIRQHFGDSRQKRWELRLGHNQEISPYTKLRVDANVISDGSYYQDYSFNLYEQLSQTLRSDATLTHTFPNSKNSFSANLHHEQNLLTDEITQNIPRITFRRGQSAIFSMPEKALGDTSVFEPRWYHNLYWSYSGEYKHYRVLNQVIASDDTSLVQTRRSGAKHSLRFNSPQKILKYLSITPSINYDEHWFDESWDYTDNPEGTKVQGFAARRTFSTALSLSTKLYGYWTPPIPGVEAIRHTATPSISMSYRPDFSDPAWGYFQEVTEADGSTTTKDRFAGSLFGSTSSSRSMSMSYQLSNLLQMKYGSGEEQKKRDLFTLNLSGSYNFALDSLQFSPLSTSLRASPINRSQPLGPLESLSLDLSTTHSFYKWGGSGEYDEFYFNPEAGKILRLTNFNISTTTKFSLGTLVHAPEDVKLEEDGEEFSFEEAALDTTPEIALPPPSKRDWFLGQVPWDLSLTFRYNSSRTDPDNPSDTFWMNASVDASITQNWQISYNTRVDLINYEVVSAGLTIYRDMHCWEGRLVWNPHGPGQGYFLKINIKSTQLQDLKVEKRRGQGSFMGF